MTFPVYLFIQMYSKKIEVKHFVNNFIIHL